MPTNNIPLISVVVPAYNHADYIDQTIRSIAAQDYPNLEIIVVDDGSSDGTAEAAEEALRRGGRPSRLIRQENAGAHAALNRGIGAAAGEYIAILNSDDRYLPGRLSRMLAALRESGRRFAYSGVSHVDAIGFPHPYQQQYLRYLDLAAQFPTPSFSLLRKNLGVTTGNFFFHRSLFAEVGLFAPYITCHDWDYLLRVLLVEEPVFVNEILLEYRIHAHGTLQKYIDVVNEETAQIMLNYLTRVQATGNPLAPGPKQWGKLWNDFSDGYLERIRAFPQVSTQLDAMRFDGGEALNRAAEPLPVVTNFLTGRSDSPDLDLTQITLDIPNPLEEAKSQPRLLILLPWMVMGGAERFILNLIDQLKERGWQVSIACSAPSDNAWKDEFAARSDDILILPEVVPFRDYPRYLRYFIALRRFDALLAQGSIEGYRLLPALRALFPRLPILDYLHFVTPDWMDGGFPRLSCLYRDAIDLSIASCQQVAGWMAAQGIDAARLRVCPIGVDPQTWRPDADARQRVRRELNLAAGDVAILYAARLEAQKQPLVFAETLRLLAAAGVAFKAIIAGDGSLRADLEQKLTRDGLMDRVTLLGPVKSQDMPALLAAGDLFFLPSQNEGISAALYEAMAAGLPVVGADVGGQRELVTPECGLLLPPVAESDQPAAYTAALRDLIADAPRRQRMGAASRARILEGFTLDHMGERIAALLAETAQAKREGALEQPALPDDQRLLRETRHVIEYLQVRQEWRGINERHLDLMQKYAELSDQYFALLQPKPASHWFYLWLRQLLFPLFNPAQHGGTLKIFTPLQKWFKHRWIVK